MVRTGTMVRTAVALSCAAVAVSGCGGGSPRSAAPRANAQERMDFAVIGVEARIGGDDVLGSGFVIDGERGLVLTAAHTVWGARSLKLSTGLGVLHGRIVARAPCDDLALLEIYPRIPGLAALPDAPGGSAGTQLLRSLGRRHTDRQSEGAALASIPVRDHGGAPIARRRPAAVERRAARLAAGARGLRRPGRRSGRPARRHGAGDERPARRRAGAWPCRGREIRKRLDQLQPGPRSVYVGWADQYRCVGRQDAYAREMHPGYRLSDARFNAPVAPTRLPGTRRDGWLMTAVAEEHRGPAQRLPRWAIAAAGVVMVVFLLAPGGGGAA